MQIKELLSALELGKKNPIAALGGEASRISADSRDVQPGDLFIAIRGTRFDSHQHLPQVCAQNPALVIVEDRSQIPASFTGPVLQVPDSRQALALLASRFYQEPSRHLFCFGVTGTNGKTSCTYLMEHILTRLGLPTGVIGTVEHRLGKQIWPTENTTPGPLELQSRLAEMRTAGARALAMEVSSHALEQRRADGVHFNSILFTNLTRDHLDYHGSMEAYFAAKQRLFTDFLWHSQKRPIVAAVNTDDEWGRKLRVAFPAETLGFGEDAGADFRFALLNVGFAGTKFRLDSRFGSWTGEVPLCGRYNIYNVVGCVVAALAVGSPPDASLRSLDNFTGVPGRLQKVLNNRGLHVFIDYAHTPDALLNMMKALVEVRAHSKDKAKIWLVFGCGGDRDQGKRPQMAQIAEKYADQIIVTSDNPRTESPAAILGDIDQGFTKDTKRRLIVDRAEAIGVALREAAPDDVVVIAGKGHEDYQVIGTEKIHFSDLEVAQDFLK